MWIDGVELDDTTVRELQLNGELPDAPQGALRRAVAARLEKEQSALLRSATVDESERRTGWRLGTITALRWMLALPESARDAMGGVKTDGR